jgi:hypothetical protein
MENLEYSTSKVKIGKTQTNFISKNRSTRYGTHRIAAILNGPQELGTLDAKIGAGSGDGDEIVSGSEKLE